MDGDDSTRAEHRDPIRQSDPSGVSGRQAARQERSARETGRTEGLEEVVGSWELSASRQERADSGGFGSRDGVLSVCIVL